MEGKSGTINKELDFRSWHCGRQGKGKFIKSQILDQSFKIKSWILDLSIVEGKGGKCKIKSWNLDYGIVEGKREEV